jgi:hypothetical protein
MTDIAWRLRKAAADYDEVGWHADVLEAADQIERLRAALARLLHETMYKDHPEASQMAIDALARTGTFDEVPR